jgi:hypothetical protein
VQMELYEAKMKSAMCLQQLGRDPTHMLQVGVSAAIPRLPHHWFCCCFNPECKCIRLAHVDAIGR